MKDLNSKKVIEILKAGGVGVIPTDTIYGIVGSALERDTVKKIYKLRKRDPKKPAIILIGSFKYLSLFDIGLDKKTKSILDRLWPGRVSVILPCRGRKFAYLHRGTNALAFRVPQKKNLVNLLKKTGPLIAPSANFEGEPPALTIRAAKRYFGEQADFYVDGGRLNSKPSTLVKLEKDELLLLRDGVARIPTGLLTGKA